TYLNPWAFKHVVAGDRLFYANYSDTSTSLWVTDGTDAGTQELLKPGTTNVPFNPSEMLAVGNQVYFAARHPDYGYELWRSDGTGAGTEIAADIEPGRNDSSPEGLQVIDGKLYFSADRRTVGRELFVLDLPTE
ncbi:MAG: hyalin, partial [Verrucomicrobiaceae bacterium]